MKQVQMEATLRTELKKNAMNRLRDEGMVPAVLYGQGEEAVALQLVAKDFDKMLSTNGINVLVQLKMEGESAKDETVMVKSLQRHPLTSKVLHIDFLKISMDKPLETVIPVKVIGTAPGTKEGGMLQLIHRELHIKSLPSVIPSTLDIDVSELHIGDSLAVKDIKVVEGIEICTDAKEAVVHIVAPRVEKATATTDEEAAPIAAAEAKQPEVIGEKEREARRADKA